MAYDGWIEFGGVELINLSRTAQLAELMGVDTVWTDPDSVDWIDAAVGGTNYGDITTAPWYDAGFVASMEFAGLVPLSVQGLDDSALSGETTEYIGDGGYTSKSRNGTKPIVASVAIIASTERGAEYGRRWLSKVLRGSGNSTFCQGDDLRYLQFQGDDTNLPAVRHRRNVRTTRGLSVTRKRVGPCSSTWFATFTWTDNDSYEYGNPVTLLNGLGLKPVTNLIHNSGFETDTTTGWATNAGVTMTVDTTTFHSGTRSAKGVTTAPGVGFVSPVTVALGGPGMDSANALGKESLSMWLKAAVGVTFQYRLREWSADGSTALTTPNYATVAATGAWQRVGFTIDKTQANSLVAPEVSILAAGTFWMDDVTLTHTDAPVDVTDVAAGPSVLQQGHLLLSQVGCPVYNYSPIYDPNHSALLPAPTAPEFYPDGWIVTDGLAFERYWAQVAAVEPSGLFYVPFITLTSTVDARFVRVMIFDGATPEDSQCNPLFTATISYLPAGKTFVLDGEQKATYVTNPTRRTDSLVYGPNAAPVQWASFSDNNGLKVAVDLYADSTSANGYTGNGSVVLTASLIPKSD